MTLEEECQAIDEILQELGEFSVLTPREQEEHAARRPTTTTTPNRKLWSKAKPVIKKIEIIPTRDLGGDEVGENHETIWKLPRIPQLLLRDAMKAPVPVPPIPAPLPVQAAVARPTSPIPLDPILAGGETRVVKLPKGATIYVPLASRDIG